MPINPSAAYSLDFRGNNNYSATGTISTIFDSKAAGFSNVFKSYVASVNAPAGTSITWSFRGSDTIPGISSVVYETSIAELKGRYIQLKADFVKADTSVISPEIFSASTVSVPGGEVNAAAMSQAFDNVYWTKTQSSVIAQAAIAPDGTRTAYKLVEDTTAAGAHILFRSSFGSTFNSMTYSIYLKAAEKSKVRFGTASASESCVFTLSGSGTISDIGASVTNSSIQDVGDGWYRCSSSFSNATIAKLYSLYLYDSTSTTYTGNGIDGVYVWGAQVEGDVSAPSTYIPTTFANTARSALSGDRAIMIEEATTNGVQRSQDFLNAYWVMNQGAISSGFIAPDGTSTAFKMFENAVNTRHYVYSPGDFTAGSQRTYSVYAKVAEVTSVQLTTSNSSIQEFVNFDLSNGVVASSGTLVSRAYIEPANDGWYRCSMTIASNTGTRMVIRTVNSSNTDSYVGDPASGVLIWGAQCEVKAYQTSYIPTTSAAVTRNAESLVMPISAVNITSGSFIGRAYVSGDLLGTSVNQHHLFFHSTAPSNNYFRFLKNSTTQWIFQTGNGVGTNTTVAANTVLGQGWHTFGCIWNSTESAIWINGAKVASVTGAINLPTLSTGVSLGLNWNNQISDLVFYNEVLSNSEMSYFTSTGAVIPLDHRTAYSLRFQDNLNHGEGGYRITPVKALDQVGTITGSTMSWNTVIPQPASGSIDWGTSTNVTIGTGTIQKTGGTNGVWDAETFSANHILTNNEDGAISFKPSQTTANIMVGFAQNNSLSTFNTIQHALYVTVGGVLAVYENGVSVLGSGGSYTTSDILTVERKNGTVNYLKNGVSFYTSLLASTSATFAKTVFFTTSGAINSIATYKYPNVSIDSSIDNGSTWYPVASSGAITGLSSETTAVGKNLLIRQKLITPASAVAPQLTDITTQITQKQTKNKNEYIKPIYSSLKFTPTNVTKWQVENKKYSTSYQLDGTTRVFDNLSFPASGIINGTNGTVVVRFYDDGDITVGRNRIIFACTNGSNANSEISLYQIVNPISSQAAYLATSGAVLQICVKSQTLSVGWHTIALRWNSGSLSTWIDGMFAASGLITSPPIIGASHNCIIGRSRNNAGNFDSLISQVDIFGEALTDTEMTEYTAASGTNIAVTEKHTYQLKFEDNLEYGMAGTYMSRALDSQVPGARWATFQKQDVVPANTSIIYEFCASDNIAGPFANYTTDITAITGRYIKVKIICMSSDVNNFNPQVLDNTVRVYPKSV